MLAIQDDPLSSIHSAARLKLYSHHKQSPQSLVSSKALIATTMNGHLSSAVVSQQQGSNNTAAVNSLSVSHEQGSDDGRLIPTPDQREHQGLISSAVVSQQQDSNNTAAINSLLASAVVNTAAVL